LASFAEEGETFPFHERLGRQLAVEFAEARFVLEQLQLARDHPP
jgi:hypothetical protein